MANDWDTEAFVKFLSEYVEKHYTWITNTTTDTPTTESTYNMATYTVNTSISDSPLYNSLGYSSSKIMHSTFQQYLLTSMAKAQAIGEHGVALQMLGMWNATIRNNFSSDTYITMENAAIACDHLLTKIGIDPVFFSNPKKKSARARNTKKAPPKKVAASKKAAFVSSIS